MMQSTNDVNELFARIHGYYAAMKSGELTEEQHAEFEALICNNPTACEQYIWYMAVTSDLRAVSGQAVLKSDEDLQIAKAFYSAAVAREDLEPAPLIETEEPARHRDATASPFVTAVLGNPLAYFSSGWPVAYLIATAIFAVGALIGGRTYVSRPVLVAVPSDPRPASLDPRLAAVGQITRSVDCRWADTMKPSVSRNVAMGQELSLVSGVIEITYTTGAKVILQSPVTYRVDGSNSGYLLIGRLTGKVESEEAKGFAIRTPTAVVTDLGTEFGVSVADDGASEVHVLRGSVEARLVGSDVKSRGHITLDAGDAVRIGHGMPAPQKVTANAALFTREMETPSQSFSDLIVAEDFAYPVGPIGGAKGGTAGVGSSWIGAWFRNGRVAGGELLPEESTVASRMFRPAIGGSASRPIYFAVRLRKTGTTEKYVICLQLTPSVNGGTDYYEDATIGLVNDHFRVILSGGDLDHVRYEDFGTYTPGQDVLIVAKLEFNVDGDKERLRAWINPTGRETADTVSPVIQEDLRWTYPRCIHLRNWTGPDGTCFVEDVRVGYSWEAVIGKNHPPVHKEQLEAK